jgi:hypothetical protein
MAEFVCSTPDCGKLASLACPTCIKIGIPPSRFCDQECFKRSWASHKELHKAVKQAREEVKVDPTAIPNEFYGFNFTGALVSCLCYFFLDYFRDQRGKVLEEMCLGTFRDLIMPITSKGSQRERELIVGPTPLFVSTPQRRSRESVRHVVLAESVSTLPLLLFV